MEASLSELTPIIFDMELNHLGSETTNYHTRHFICCKDKIGSDINKKRTNNITLDNKWISS